ncbi:Abi family protein [Campylobacter sp. FMV-PI01]|uniref:Abi family protein n=1 Tax=Campylobacter portucalensis TaxID=2608384 RepID=A0A6L5WL01_9BACT|nr:Abi family protein [Campylobacter portucalensis]MSN96411.1 Abi family protein [Campylobacter portucalensis]
MKNKLSIDQQIQHMKENGITFTLFKESEAKEFLQHSNYFFKVKSFAKNYQKIDDKYIDLDFIYLRELALMDTLLRNIVLEISLIIEHILKVNFINDITNNPLEDGYIIIKKFLDEKREPTIFTNYNKKRDNIDFYTRGLMDKYYKYNFPVWAFVEILTFSELLTLLKFYYIENNNAHAKFYNNSLLYNVKKLRNVLFIITAF